MDREFNIKLVQITFGFVLVYGFINIRKTCITNNKYTSMSTEIYTFYSFIKFNKVWNLESPGA